MGIGDLELEYKLSDGLTLNTQVGAFNPQDGEFELKFELQYEFQMEQDTRIWNFNFNIYFE
jgi:hypothetical protein